MKTTARRIWLVLAMLSLAILSCNLVTGNRDGDREAESAAPQALAEEQLPATQLGGEYRSLEGGYAFSVVPGYELEEFFGIVSMYPPGVDPDVGPVFVLVGGIDDEVVSNVQLLDDFTSGLGEDGEVFEQSEVRVGDQTGLAVGFKGTIDGQDAIGHAAFVAVSPTQMFSLLGVATPDLWDEALETTFEAVLGSVTFFEPEDDPGGTSIGSGEPEPEVDLEPPIQKVIRQWAAAAPQVLNTAVRIGQQIRPPARPTHRIVGTKRQPGPLWSRIVWIGSRSATISR